MELPFTQEELMTDSIKDLARQDLATVSPKALSAHLSSLVETGEMDFLQIVKLKKLEKILSGFFAVPTVKTFLEREVEKFGSDNTRLGMKFIAKDSGVSYNYMVCNHPGLTAAYELRKQVDEYIKQLEAELKAIPMGQQREVIVTEIPAPMTMETCGELSTIFPPVRTAGRTVEWKET